MDGAIPMTDSETTTTEPEPTPPTDAAPVNDDAARQRLAALRALDLQRQRMETKQSSARTKWRDKLTALTQAMNELIDQPPPDVAKLAKERLTQIRAKFSEREEAESDKAAEMSALKATLDKLEQAIIELIRTDYSTPQQHLAFGQAVGRIAMTDETTRQVYKALKDAVHEGATLDDDMAELQRRITDLGADMRFDPEAPTETDETAASSEPVPEEPTESPPAEAAANE